MSRLYIELLILNFNAAMFNIVSCTVIVSEVRIGVVRVQLTEKKQTQQVATLP